MKTNNNELGTTQHKNVVVPMFIEENIEARMVDNKTNEEISYEISLFDVKELYDLAYSKDSDSSAFKAIMAEAVKMDMAYRQQLSANKAYKSPFDTYDKKTAPAPAPAPQNKAMDAA